MPWINYYYYHYMIINSYDVSSMPLTCSKVEELCWKPLSTATMTWWRFYSQKTHILMQQTRYGAI
jgi:hypothetical protein